MVVLAQQWDFSLLLPGNTFTNADKSFDKPYCNDDSFYMKWLCLLLEENFLNWISPEHPNSSSSLGVGGNKTASWTSVTLRQQWFGHATQNTRASPPPVFTGSLSQWVLLYGRRKQGVCSRITFSYAVVL